MFNKLKEYWQSIWNWIQALWEKHDEQLEEMVGALLPLIAEVALRSDLSGEQKRKAVVDAVLDSAEGNAEAIALSMVNEAVEVAANRYNIQLGKLTVDQMDKATKAAIKAGRDYADKRLDLSGNEAESAGVALPRTLSNGDL